MIEEERKPRQYLLRYDVANRMYVLCRQRNDGGFNETGKRFDSERIVDRLVTAARLGDAVYAHNNDPSLEKLIQSAYERMKGRPPVNDCKKDFVQGTQAG